MNILQAIKRELRNARRVISNPDKFSQNTIETSWAVIKSAAKRGIFTHPLPYQQTCRAYEREEPNKPSHQVES
jgi:hypothetical protein